MSEPYFKALLEIELPFDKSERIVAAGKLALFKEAAEVGVSITDASVAIACLWWRREEICLQACDQEDFNRQLRAMFPQGFKVIWCRKLP